MENMMGVALNWLITKALELVIGLLVLWIGWKVIGSVIKKFDAFLEKRSVDTTLRSFLEALANVGLKIGLVVFIVLPIMGADTASFAALVASAGVAIGLALQGSLSNFAGGVIILMMRPFKIGDFIEVGSYAGSVDRIKIFYTELLTPDNKLILIPNGTLANGSLINYSAKELRRVDLVFGVGYEQDILKVKRVLTQIVEQHPSILKNPEPFISLSEHGPSSLNFVVRAWCQTPDYWKVYFDLLEEVKVKFDEEEISIPYPQLDVHVLNQEQ